MLDDPDERRLREVLNTIHLAMLPPPTPRQLAERMKEVVRSQANLIEALAQMHMELTEAIAVLQEMPSELSEERQAARAQMVEHFREDLRRTEEAQRVVDDLLKVLYAEFYTFL